MDLVARVLDGALRTVLDLADLIIAVLLSLETWMRSQLTSLGVPADLQTGLLIAAAILLILGALRLLGGLVRGAALLVLVLIAVNLLMPALQP